MGPMTQAAIYGTWRGDLYAVFAGWEPFGSMWDSSFITIRPSG